MDPSQLPADLAGKSWHGISILTLVFILHTAGQLIGRAITALRGQGGLKGIFQSIYMGSATAGEQPKNVPISNAGTSGSAGVGGTAALLFILSLCTIFMTGCGTPRLEQGGAYAPVDTNGVATAAPDYAFFVVDSAYDLAYSAVDSVFTFERQNRAMLWAISPTIKHSLDNLRPQAWGIAVKYAKARAAYMANPVPANLTLLQQLLAEVQQLSATVQALLPQQAATKPAATAAPPAPAAPPTPAATVAPAAAAVPKPVFTPLPAQ